MRALMLLLIASTASAEPWKVTDTAKGEETEIHAVDVPIDLLATTLLDGAIVVQRHAARVTGDVVAPSLRGAVGAAFGAAGVQLPVPFAIDTLRKGATVDLQFADAPSEDLLRIVADTLHANVIVRAGAALPHVAVHAKRVASDQFLELLARVDQLEVARVGATFYLLPRGEKLPALTKQKEIAVELDAKAAPAKLAAAALAAATKTAPATCGDAIVSVRIKRVPLAEAVRAIAVNGGALAPGDCALVPTTRVDLDKLELVAIATAGTTRIAAGYVGDKPVLIASGDGLEVGSGYVAANKKGVQLHTYDLPDEQPPVDFKAWRAGIVGTALLVRRGVSWRGWLLRKDGRIQPAGMPSYDTPVGTSFTVDATGVTVTYDGKSELIPLRK